MRNLLILMFFCLVVAVPGVIAQTTVTTSGGTANTVPLFTGTSTLGNSAIAQSSSGNVGIGTTAPAATLHVAAPWVNYSPSLAYGSAASFLFNAAGIDLAIGGAPTAPWSLWMQTRNSQNAAQDLAINPLGGNVGIGTSSPAGQLHVVPALSTNPATASQIILGGNTGSLTNANFNLGSNQIIIQASSYTNAFNGHGADSVLVSGGNITAAPGIGSADISGGGVSIAGGSATGVTGTSAFGGFVNIQGGLATASGAYNYVGPVVLQTSGGNVGIGTTNPQAKLEVNGSLRFTSDGSTQSTAWTGILCGGDYAEAVDVRGDLKHYGPGDVLVIASGDGGDVEKASEPYSTMVAGIYATKPGVIGRRQTLLKDSTDVPMAMVGIVPAKVSAENGAIRKGDLLVTASTPGYAMKGTDRSRLVGAVIGKAMGSLDSSTGVIEVLVTLQ